MTRALLATAQLFCIVMFLVGCTPTVVDTSCTAFSPISFSGTKDTQETIAQVRAHNSAWHVLCGR